MTPEFSRPLPLSRVGRDDYAVDITANDDERAALAKRFGLPAVEQLHCRFQLQNAPGNTVAARGVLTARVQQACVVSLEPFPADIAETFAVRFVPEGALTEELDPEADDEVPYTGDSIDLGEAVAEQLALALDPYPRKPGAESLEQTVPESPFAMLRGKF